MFDFLLSPFRFVGSMIQSVGNGFADVVSGAFTEGLKFGVVFTGAASIAKIFQPTINYYLPGVGEKLAPYLDAKEGMGTFVVDKFTTGLMVGGGYGAVQAAAGGLAGLGALEGASVSAAVAQGAGTVASVGTAGVLGALAVQHVTGKNPAEWMKEIGGGTDVKAAEPQNVPARDTTAPVTPAK